MNKFDLSNREEQVLRCIHRYMMEQNEPPTPQLLAEMMLPYLIGAEIDSVSDGRWLERQRKPAHKNILTVVARLVKKEYVERKGSRVHLTSKAIRYFESIYETVTTISAYAFLPARITIRGYVTAGRTDANDLDVDLPAEVLGTIPIPNAQPDRLTYALQVRGRSMEHEGVFEGDYIILEEFISTEWPRNGEMIVTRYIEMPANEGNMPGTELDSLTVSMHTLKIYQEVYENGQRYHRLSWKRDHASNPYLIKAAHIEPVGRVIGIYRPFR